ncbi:hypothetical protein V6N13_088808 [Hibiscus sabdariffa]
MKLFNIDRGTNKGMGTWQNEHVATHAEGSICGFGGGDPMNMFTTLRRMTPDQLDDKHAKESGEVIEIGNNADDKIHIGPRDRHALRRYDSTSSPHRQILRPRRGRGI